MSTRQQELRLSQLQAAGKTTPKAQVVIAVVLEAVSIKEA